MLSGEIGHKIFDTQKCNGQTNRQTATAKGNMHRKIGKVRACDSGDILADRQTDRHADRHAHHNISPPLPPAK